MSQVIQNMESTPNFLKNTFKDNLLQFVLLFAAVTLGFFAENLREENAQRKLEIKLMHSMVADLARNERLLSDQHASLTARKIASDSLAYFFNQPDMQQQTSEIYFYARKLGIYAGEFPLASRSLDQLKNSGLFTLISKEEVADSLSTYDNLKTQYEQRIKWYFEDVKKVQDENKKFFDAHVFEKATIYTEANRFEMLRPKGNPPLISSRKEDLQHYYNTFYYLKRNTETQLRDVDQLIRSTVALRKLINEAYGFEY
jgi:hypothetical protein